MAERPRKRVAQDIYNFRSLSIYLVETRILIHSDEPGITHIPEVGS